MRISDWSSDVCSSDLTDGQAVDRALRCGVPDILSRAADGGCPRRQVDDGAALSAVAPRHATDRGARAPDAAQHVEIHDSADGFGRRVFQATHAAGDTGVRSEEHTSELQSLMRISYAVFCLKKKRITHHT